MKPQHATTLAPTPPTDNDNDITLSSSSSLNLQFGMRCPVPAEVHVHPPAQPDWNNLKVLHRNRLPSRAYFVAHPDEVSARDAAENPLRFERAAAEGHDPSLRQLLSGPGSAWKFHLSNSPFVGPSKFYSQEFDASTWHDIDVPGMWQLQGFGKGPQYTNVVFPFPIDVPNVPADDNECGRYVHTFTVKDRLASSDNVVRLRFDGVDSAYSVWLNGRYVGYSQGSRNPAEFDVTKIFNVRGENTLAVEVYQRCDGSYIEDQDMWWLSGIFRDVSLVVWPSVHVVDYAVDTILDDNYEHAKLQVRLHLSQDADIELALYDPQRQQVLRCSFLAGPHGGCTSFDVSNPSKWTAETPDLYTLIINVPGSSIAQRVGFRTVEAKDGVFLVNNRPVTIRGVNRHEHHPSSGRTVPYHFMRQDLLLMKTHNINAVRTSHYPNDARMYDVADELGLWVLDEADLECHGLEMVDGWDNAHKYTSDNPDWEEAYLDRAKQMVHRDRNHACVVIWSLGNEAFYGRNHKEMSKWIHANDGSRPVHYQPDRNAETADMFGEFYPEVDWVDARGQEGRDKPTLLVEYGHAMGNGPGNLKEYIELFYKHPRLMGGFIWEWANHGLRTLNAAGEPYMAYGGDFGEDPHDKNFVMDGLCFSNHTPTPGLTEYAKTIEPVQTLRRCGDEVVIVNRYDFATLDHLYCVAKVVYEDGQGPEFHVVVPYGIKPHTEASLKVTVPPTYGVEAHLQLSFRLVQNTTWALAGFQVATGEVALTPAASLASIVGRFPIGHMFSPVPRVTHTSPTAIEITSISGDTTWGVDLTTGALSSWTKTNVGNILTKPVTLDLFRALTDNDRGSFGRSWLDRRLHQAKDHTHKVQWQETPSGVQVVVSGRYAPPVFAWGVETTTTLTFYRNHVSLRVKGTPRGPGLPETFARIGLNLCLRGVDEAQWWGRGPGESYRDKKHSQLFGRWTRHVDDLWVDYEFPQEGGNRTDVRWVRFLGADVQSQGEPSSSSSSSSSFSPQILKAYFGDLGNASFGVSRVTALELEEAQHPHDLKRATSGRRARDEVCVRLDWAHMGLGTGSCGPGTLPEYRIRADEEFEFELLLE